MDKQEPLASLFNDAVAASGVVEPSTAVEVQKANPVCTIASSAGCQTDELDLGKLMATKDTLTRQETELQEELGVLRGDLMKQKVESEKLMNAWTQAQVALKASGKELDGVQRVSADCSGRLCSIRVD